MSRTLPSTAASTLSSSSSEARSRSVPSVSAASSAAYELMVLRKPRTATRIWCTPTMVTRRAAGSWSRSWLRSSPSASRTGETPRSHRSGTSPTARASFDDDDEACAPAATQAAETPANASPALGSDGSTSSASHSRHPEAEPPGTKDSVVTRSSQNSTTAVPSASRSRLTRRSLSIRAIGANSRRRTRPATASTSSAGTSSPSGARSSMRPSRPGSLRCQPASSPPVRRRRVTLCRVSARSAVS